MAWLGSRQGGAGLGGARQGEAWRGMVRGEKSKEVEKWIKIKEQKL